MAQEFSISSAPSTPSGSKETHHALQPAGDDAQQSQSTTSSTKASSKKLSFREHLFDQADSLFAAPAPGMTDAGNLKRTLEDFSDMLRDLAQIEEKYAADLDRVAKKERRVCGDVPSVDEAFDAVRGMLANRADQGKLMAEQHDGVQQTIETDALKLTKLRQAKGHNYSLLKQKFAETSAVAEKLLKQVDDHVEGSGGAAGGWASGDHEFLANSNKNYYEAGASTSATASGGSTSSTMSQQRCVPSPTSGAPLVLQPPPTQTAVFDAIKRAYIFEDEFKRVADEATEAAKVYHTQMNAILDASQDMEEKKLQCFRDACMRLLVYETSWARNLQYDIEGIFKTCEDVDPSGDLQALIKRKMSANNSRSSSPGGGSRPTTEDDHARSAFDVRTASESELLTRAFLDAVDCIDEQKRGGGFDLHTARDVVSAAQQMQSFGIQREDAVQLACRVASSQCDHLASHVLERFIALLKERI
eukprot:g13270.t1